MIGRAEEAEKEEEEGFRVEKNVTADVLYTGWVFESCLLDMAGIPQRLRTVVQQVEVFCHRTRLFRHDTHCCRDEIPKSFVFILNEGAQFHDFAIFKLIPQNANI